jgi:hypothetical protein
LGDREFYSSVLFASEIFSEFGDENLHEIVCELNRTLPLQHDIFRETQVEGISFLKTDNL